MSSILIFEGKNDKKDIPKTTQQTISGPKNSSHRNGGCSSATNRASPPVSLCSTNSPASNVTAKNNQVNQHLDENSRNLAPPQYSDAVRLPNINQSSHSTSSQMASISTTEQTGIL